MSHSDRGRTHWNYFNLRMRMKSQANQHCADIRIRASMQEPRKRDLYAMLAQAAKNTAALQTEPSIGEGKYESPRH